MKIHPAFIVAASMAAVGLAAPAASPATEPTPILKSAFEEARGTIRSVEGDAFTLDVDGETVTVRVSERTRFTLDGEEATRADVLKAGHQVAVTHEAGMASLVAATSEPAVAAEALRGQVRAVEENAFVIAHGEETTRVQTTNDTHYSLDGDIAPRADVLKIGRSVEVEHADGVASAVSANSSAKLATDSVRGTVGGITDDGFTLTTEGEPMRLRVNDRTKYLLDGEPADKSAVLRAGQVVSVEHTDGLATSVSATSTR